MILVDFSALMHQCIFSTVKLLDPKVVNNYYVTSEFIGPVKYTILDRLFEVQEKNKSVYGNMVICIDKTQSGSWRKAFYKGYKASRKTDREASLINYSEVFQDMNNLIQHLDSDTPWKVVSVDTAEADDVILCLSKAYAQTEKILIISSDKDMIQAQKFGDVKQYSLLTSDYIVPETKNVATVDEWIVEHIVLGDAADEIPKIVDNTEFTQEFKKHLQNLGLSYTEADFEDLPDARKAEIISSFDEWKYNRKNEKTEKNVYKTVRFGPVALKKKIEEYGNLDNWLMSNALYFRHYERNKKLIAFDGIPKSIYDECLINYKNSSKKLNALNFKNYLLSNNLTRLIPILPSNFTDSTLYFS